MDDNIEDEEEEELTRRVYPKLRWRYRKALVDSKTISPTIAPYYTSTLLELEESTRLFK